MLEPLGHTSSLGFLSRGPASGFLALRTVCRLLCFFLIIVLIGSRDAYQIRKARVHVSLRGISTKGHLLCLWAARPHWLSQLLSLLPGCCDENHSVPLHNTTLHTHTLTHTHLLCSITHTHTLYGGLNPLKQQTKINYCYFSLYTVQNCSSGNGAPTA